MSEEGTKIYGASDDLIEFDGEFRGEVGCYGTDDKEQGALVVVSDGTLLEVKYGKDDRGIWAVKLLRQGPLFLGIDQCVDEGSDVARFGPGVKWCYAADSWEAVYPEVDAAAQLEAMLAAGVAPNEAESLAAGAVPSEEISGVLTGSVDDAPDIPGWAFAGNPILASDGYSEVVFDGTTLDIAAGGPDIELPLAVIDRLRAMWRERRGA